tara:strand:+ start:189 stop:992 length:804 start_codon:yes stop_codon:yes gene_type:complete
VKINSVVNPDYNILSIQVSLDGFSFYIENELLQSRLSQEYIPFSETFTPEKTLEEIEKIFEEFTQLQESFKKVNVVYHNELYAFVPATLFDENHLTDYLKYNTKILKTDFAVYDEINEYDLVNVFIPFANINNFFFDNFGSFTYNHGMSIFVKNVLDKAVIDDGKDKMVAHVGHSTFDLIVHKDNNLLLGNTFSYSTPADFLYYILFCAEQLNLNPDEVALELIGDIEEGDALYTVLYEYIRNIKIQNTEKEDSDFTRNSFFIEHLD